MKFLAIVGVVILMAASVLAGITDPSCSGILHGVARNAENQPVPGIRLVLWPIGVDLDYVLPTATSNEAGTYSFEHVCAGQFTVLVDDERAGYPPKIWSYLLGYKREAKVTTEHLRIELPVVVPPKAALLEVVAAIVAQTQRFLRCELCSRPPRSKCTTGLRLGMIRANHYYCPRIRICCAVCLREDTANGRRAIRKESESDFPLGAT